MSVKLNFVTERTVEIYLSEQEVRLIALVANVNFQTVECVSHSKAGFIHRRLFNFCALRSDKDFFRNLKYYDLTDLTRDSIGRVAAQFEEANKVECCVCVTIY